MFMLCILYNIKLQVAGCCECGNEPLGSTNAGNFLSNLGPFTFSGKTLLHEVSYITSNPKGQNLESMQLYIFP